MLQLRRNQKAGKRDKLPSRSAAKKKILPYTGHRQGKGLNNRAENSHQSKISHGQLLVAMILNCLGFTSWTLHMYPEYFAD